MTARPASRGLQTARLLMALLFGASGLALTLVGEWLSAAVFTAGAAGAAVAFRRGVWDRDAAVRFASEWTYPRLIGLAVGLVVAVCAGLLGFFD